MAPGVIDFSKAQNQHDQDAEENLRQTTKAQAFPALLDKTIERDEKRGDPQGQYNQTDDKVSALFHYSVNRFCYGFMNWRTEWQAW